MRAFEETQVDTTTPGGKMVFTVLGAVAELQRNLILERVKAGQRIARAKEQRPGTPQGNRRRSQDCHAARPLGILGATVCGETGLSARGTAHRAR